MGFKEVEKAFKQLCVKAEPVEEKEKKTSIPAGYEEGMRLFPVKAEKTTHYTSPPKPFNEDTLLAAMETAGNKEFDSETEKKGWGLRQQGQVSLKNWFLPVMHRERVNRYCQVPRERNW